jgi:hypothetical protein
MEVPAAAEPAACAPLLPLWPPAAASADGVLPRVPDAAPPLLRPSLPLCAAETAAAEARRAMTDAGDTPGGSTMPVSAADRIWV